MNANLRNSEHKCQFCGKTMKNYKGNVKRHEAACSRNRKYIIGNCCSLCNKSYTNPYNLTDTVHMYRHYKKNNFSGHKYVRIRPKTKVGFTSPKAHWGKNSLYIQKFP